MLLAQTKDAKTVCVIRCQITFMTRMHTSLKSLASARHSNSRNSFLPVECTLQTEQSLKTKKRMTYFPGAPLYCGRAGSDVIGCRRPTGGVFICMLQTRVTLTTFPIATPRGRSSKFPRKGKTVTVRMRMTTNRQKQEVRGSINRRKPHEEHVRTIRPTRTRQGLTRGCGKEETRSRGWKSTWLSKTTTTKPCADTRQHRHEKQRQDKRVSE